MLLMYFILGVPQSEKKNMLSYQFVASERLQLRFVEAYQLDVLYHVNLTSI